MMNWIDTIIGMKFFKEVEDEVQIIRIVDMKKVGDDYYRFTIKDSDGNKKKVEKKELEGYTPLEPDAIFTASVVTIRNDMGKPTKDVIITANRYIDTKMKLSPYVICRQCISDLFAELFCTTEENNVVGMSVNRDTCPANFDMKVMLAADSIDFHQLVNFYRNDTIDDILEMVDLFQFDTVLGELYKEHCTVFNPLAMMKDEESGWCKTFKKLLETNNFQNDINQMLGITEFDFELAPYFEKATTPGDNKIEYNVLRDDIKAWLSSIYKLNIKEASVLEYDHDVNLAEFKNARYFLFRDSTKKMYLVVYTVDGEYLESDLDAKAKEMDFSTKFKINFYNKYNQINNDNGVNIDLS